MKWTLLFLLGFVMSDRFAWGAILTSARVGGGPVQYKNADQRAWVSSTQGTLRLGFYQPRLHATGGIDLTSFRFASLPKLGVSDPLHGNSALLHIGVYREPWTIWLATGGGQLRMYDRPPPRKDEPRRYLLQERQLGVSYDLYQADYGKIEACVIWHRLLPEKEGRQRFGLSMIEAWHLELGVKMLSW
jgi:hypothetical protein